MNKVLFADRVSIEKKTFDFQLLDNHQGRCLRITEEAAGRRNTIVIPAPGLYDIRALISKMSEMD